MWFDMFCEIAKLDTEPWRKELLAKALAIESFKCGSIGLNTLEIISTIEKEMFYSFGNTLDIAISINDELLIPNISAYSQITSLILPNSNLNEFNNTMINMTDLGLIKNYNYLMAYHQPNNQYIFSYGNETYFFDSDKQLCIENAFSLTTLGKKLASLYERKANDLGKIIFKTLVEDLSFR